MQQPVPIQDGREIQKAQNGIGIGQQGDPAYTLDTTGAQAIAQPVPYDLFQITAPVNRQNRKPGDPCHTLARDNAAHAAVAFTPGNLARGAGPSPNAEVAPTMKCSAGRGADDQRTCVAFPINTLTLGGRPDAVNDKRMTMGVGENGDPQFTLQAAHGHAVAHAFYSTGGTPGSSVNASGPTVMAFDWQSGGDSRGLDPKNTAQLQRCQTPAVHQAMTVRRLTPKEAERLQAFPDDYTLIPWRKKPAAECPDGPRYKALGNSMAVNCMAWIGERIAAVEANNGAASAPPSPPTPGTGGAA